MIEEGSWIYPNILVHGTLHVLGSAIGLIVGYALANGLTSEFELHDTTKYLTYLASMTAGEFAGMQLGSQMFKRFFLSENYWGYRSLLQELTKLRDEDPFAYKLLFIKSDENHKS